MDNGSNIMGFQISRFKIKNLIILWLFFIALVCYCAEVPVKIETNVTIRIMSANLTGSSQQYEAPAIRIFQGLKPDLVAIQEFNYGNNTSNDIRYFVNIAFGTNYYFYREPNSEYTIPNGIISKYPIIKAGTWDDPEIPDRGFAWAVIDIPGDTNITVISVHLKASSSDANRRTVEAITLKSLILTNVSGFYVLAGDLNTSSANEQCLTIFRSFLVDEPIPTDTTGDPDTNLNRNERYDYILSSPELGALITPTILGTHTFSNGLVFDSRNYPFLSELQPIQKNDSGYAQHMAVIKDYKIVYSITNFIIIDPPKLLIDKWLNVMWTGSNRLNWSMLYSLDLVKWERLTTLPSTADSFSLKDVISNRMIFIKLSYP